MPPEPIAIFDWMMFQPVPSGSDSGLRKVRMRSFWYGRSSQNHATGAIAATPRDGRDEPPPRQARQEQRERAADADQHAGAEVRLQQDQAGRHAR